jgi:DNA-binding NarL/FixJ family response regulator
MWRNGEKQTEIGAKLKISERTIRRVLVQVRELWMQGEKEES